MGNLWRILKAEPHEFLPHYVTLNEFLSRLETGELERLRKNMVRALLRRRKFEDARFLGKYWLVIFDATGLFHFSERHCPHCLRKVVNKGAPEEKEIYYHHVLEAKLVLGNFRPVKEFWRTTDRGRHPFHNGARLCKGRDLTRTLYQRK